MRGKIGYLYGLFIVFQVIINHTLAASFRWSWRDKNKLAVMNSKIGTVDQYVERYIFFVERRYQKDEKFKKKVLEALQKIAVPPKALNVYPLDSPYLGCLAFAVTTEANSSDPAWKLSRKFAKSVGIVMFHHSYLFSKIYRLILEYVVDHSYCAS